MNRLQVRPPQHPHRVSAGSTLAIIVIGWWLLIGGAVVWLLPEAPASASPKLLVHGPQQTARLYRPGTSSWLLPVERRAFDIYEEALLEGSEARVNAAVASFAWIEVEHAQTVRIIAVDGDAVQVELLEGEYAGRLAWLKARHLGPAR